MAAYKTYTCEVLVIGSGGAGVRAAIELHDRGVDVCIVGKSKKREAHTIWATGGINAALGTMDPADSWQLHAADTIKDGGFINDTLAVQLLAKHAPDAVRELHRWGTPFATDRKGKLAQRFFGAATYRRACFVGDTTGKAILNTLIDQAVKRKIRFKSEIYIFSLLASRGSINGAIGIDLRKGAFVVFHAKAVVLATGGHSRIYSRSSSLFTENNGDGLSLAIEYGAKCMDMEMFQFHPTGMLHPAEARGTLVTEAVRGEGGLLTNAKGERFMKRYDKDRMELSARDIVARAAFMEAQKGHGTKHGGVWLDITHQPLSYIKKRLPRMYEQFMKYAGIDISKKKMEVGPTAHYAMGGLLVDHRSGKTTVPRLYAVGEVTSGVHGGNRLGGNSLAEICVFGHLTGIRIAADVKKFSRSLPLDEELIAEKCAALQSLTRHPHGKNPTQVKREIQELMWRHVGVIRDERTMRRGLQKIAGYQNIPLNIGTSLKNNSRLPDALDVLHMPRICEMIILSALHRTESRAAHYRSDYPQTTKRWQKNIICTPKKNNIALSTRQIPLVPQYIARLFTYTPDTDLFPDRDALE